MYTTYLKCEQRLLISLFGKPFGRNVYKTLSVNTDDYVMPN